MDDLVVAESVRPWKALADIARWILFIPVGFATMLVANIVILFVSGSSSWLLGHAFDAPYVELAACVGAGVAGVAGAALVAPSRRTWPGILMAGVIMFLALATAAAPLVLGEWIWWDQLKNLLMIVGAVMGMIWVIERT